MGSEMCIRDRDAEGDAGYQEKIWEECNLKRNESAGGWNCDGTEPADRRT